jgi:glycosyltransferase involved in cell wall biosynthesis
MLATSEYGPHDRKAPARRIAFIYHRFYDGDGKQVLIGGIETYVQRLFDVSSSLGLDPILLQSSRILFERCFGGARIFGIPIGHLALGDQNRLLYSEAINRLGEEDLIVFCTELCSVPTCRNRVINIQHGIYWDYPMDPPNRWPWLVPKLRTHRSQAFAVKRAQRLFDNCLNRVCVDYNFLNWYRATRGAEFAGNVWVIPNCCSPVPEEKIKRSETSPLKVLFARRFEIYRGTRVMADTMTRILRERPEISFTLAGEGPELSYLVERFGQHPQVQFTRYLANESGEIHLKHDLAVVPSLGSEGTSLSVAEAMGAGCAVVASSVGGITNMILDGYNGLLVAPRANEFAEAILLLAGDIALRKKLAQNAYWTARDSFSVEQWSCRWKKVIQHVSSS